MADKIEKFLAYNGKILITCADTTKLVEKARKIHDLSPVVTSAFGRVLTIAAIMGNEMKDKKNKLTIQIKGNGPIGMMVVTANNFPMVKGYVLNPQADIDLNEFGKLDVARAVGNKGYINVIKDIGLKEPYIGISPLVSGEIADDFANYFVNSEQRNSALLLGVIVDKEGVKQSSGYLINPMPDATEEEISNIEKAIFEAGSISKMLLQKLTLKQIAQKISGDKDIKVIEENITPIYQCDCSKEHMSEGLATIGKEELEDIIQKEGKAETVCHFCNKKYEFNINELKEILDKAI